MDFMPSLWQFLSFCFKLIWKIAKPILFFTGLIIPVSLELFNEIFLAGAIPSFVIGLSCLISLYIFIQNIMRKVKREPRYSIIKEILRMQQDKATTNPQPTDRIVRNTREGIIFGNKNGQIVGRHENMDGHVMVVGGTGSGKSSCVVIPTLRAWQSSIFAMDIKDGGELYEKCKQFRPNIKVFNPKDENAYGYDPYIFLRESTNPAQEARAIAQAIIPLPPEAKEPFWIESAQSILTGAILHYYTEYSFIETLENIQSVSPKELISIISQSDIKEARFSVNAFRDMEERTLSSIMGELNRGIISIVTDKDIVSALSREKNINPKDLEYGQDIFINMPEHLLRHWKNLLILMISQFLTFFEQRSSKTTKPILFMLDEFARLGKIPDIMDALATLRSKKISICIVLQSLAQLDTIYGHDERKVIADNCAYKAVLKATDPETQNYFSDLVGKYDKKKTSDTINNQPYGLPGSTGFTTTTEKDRIIQPEEFATLKDIVLLYPDGFARVDKMPYYADSFAPPDPPGTKGTNPDNGENSGEGSNKKKSSILPTGKERTALIAIVSVMIMMLAFALFITLKPTANSTPTNNVIVNATHIKTATDLMAIGNKNKNYQLDNDITLTGEWIPIQGFTGTLDGNGHIIQGLKITGDKYQYNGLFGDITGSVTIKNLGLEDVNINVTIANAYVGGFIACSKEGNILIDNCYVTGKIAISSATEDTNNTLTYYMGGFIGERDGGNVVIKNSFNIADINSTSHTYFSRNFIGGLIGTIAEPSMPNTSETIEIESCYNAGKIDNYAYGYGEANSGGLVGTSGTKINIKNSYNIGDITSEGHSSFSSDVSSAGGLVGTSHIMSLTEQSSNVQCCYNLGSIKCTTNNHKAYAGDLIGNGTNAINCYNSGNILAQTNSNWSLAESHLDAIELSYLEIRNKTSFLGFDFNNVWAINANVNDGYPYLKNVKVITANTSSTPPIQTTTSQPVTTVTQVVATQQNTVSTPTATTTPPTTIPTTNIPTNPPTETTTAPPIIETATNPPPVITITNPPTEINTTTSPTETITIPPTETTEILITEIITDLSTETTTTISITENITTPSVNSQWFLTWSWNGNSESSLDTEDGYSTIKINNSDFNDACVSLTVTVDKNTNYKLSATVKYKNFESIESSDTGANIGIWDNNRQETGFAGPGNEHSQCISSDSWINIEYEFYTEDNNEIIIYLRNGTHGGTCKGTAYFKDIKLEKID